MAKKGSGGIDKTRIQNLLNILMSGGSLGNEGLAYLKKYYNANDEFRDFYDRNFAATLNLSSGRVKDAKDTYSTFGFTPLQNAKRAGAGTNELLLRSGKRTNQTGAWQDAKIYEKGGQIAGARVSGGRMRTAAETKSIIQRGLAGASLSDEDQRIFDRWKTIQRETEENKAKAEAQKQQQAALKRQAAEERAAKFQFLGMKDDGTLNDLQIAELISQREARNKTNEELYRQQVLNDERAVVEAEQAAEKRRQQEVDNGRTADMTDEDYAKWMQMGGTKFAKWGYDADDQREVDAMDARLKEKIRSGEYSQEEIEQLRKIVDSAKQQWYKKKVSQKDNMPEGQPVISEDGQFYVSDGKWTPMPKESESIAEKQARVAQEREDKRNQKLQDRRDKWIDSRVDKLLKETNEDQADTENFGKPIYSYDTALDKARQEAATRFGPSDAEEGDLADLGFKAGTEEVDAPMTDVETWQFGSNYDDDVAHGYTGSYDDWLAEFGGGGAADETAVAEPATVAGGHVKKNYL